MSEIMLNMVCEPRQEVHQDKSHGNAKHCRLLSRRRYLESQGFINKKQNQKQNEPIHSKKRKSKNKFNGAKQSKPGAVFPNFNSSLPNKINEPTSSSGHSSQKSTYSFTSNASKSQRELTPQMAVPLAPGPLKYLALDCEMVGTGPRGCRNELARCSIVSYEGDVVYDKFIQPVNFVTDYRTRWSGIRKKDLHNATPFHEAQKEIVKIIKGKVVVGHAVHNDFKALKYFHPACHTRDTSQIPLLNQKAGLPENQCVSLKKLSKAILKKDIQSGKGGHSSVEDAKATMELYKVVERMWEQKLASQNLSASEMDIAQNQTR